MLFVPAEVTYQSDERQEDRCPIRLNSFLLCVDFFCRTYHDVALTPALAFKSKLKLLFQSIFLLSLVLISYFTCVVKLNKMISVVRPKYNFIIVY